MIGKRGKLLLLLYLIFLVVLFLMCSTDLIIREPEKEIYQIAVIIEDVRDDNYSNFRRGMEQAAIEFNADVRFITLYERLNAAQQIDLLDREQQDGADALIVAPVDENEITDAIAEKQITIPIVLLDTGEAERKTAGTITIDYKTMGRQISEQILQHLPKDCPVWIFSEPENQTAMSRSFLRGAASVLEENGLTYRIVVPDNTHGFRDVLEDLGAIDQGQAVILAESPEILSETAQILSDNPPLSRYVKGLYGRGSTLPILNGLDQGGITGICVTDEFSRGYFSVRMAIQLLDGESRKTSAAINSYYIEKQDLRKPYYEKMLFPIE